MNRSIALALVALLGLSACSTGILQSTKVDQKISGTLTRGAFEPHPIEIHLDGKTYRGEWRTGAPTAEQKAATTYPHKRHIGEVRSTLKADDGSTLDCRWNAHGNTAEGACTGDGREYPLVLK